MSFNREILSRLCWPGCGRPWHPRFRSESSFARLLYHSSGDVMSSRHGSSRLICYMCIQLPNKTTTNNNNRFYSSPNTPPANIASLFCWKKKIWNLELLKFIAPVKNGHFNGIWIKMDLLNFHLTFWSHKDLQMTLLKGEQRLQVVKVSCLHYHRHSFIHSLC